MFFFSFFLNRQTNDDEVSDVRGKERRTNIIKLKLWLQFQNLVILINF